MTVIGKPPDWFTHEEGGELRRWELGVVDPAIFARRSDRAVSICGQMVHALRWLDGRRWDCVNGWTD